MRTLTDNVPVWAMEALPEWIEPFVGPRGMPEPWLRQNGVEPYAPGVAGIDYWQANRFVVYRPETAAFLYASYTPIRRPEYRRGQFPRLETLAARYVRDCRTDTDRITRLATSFMPTELPHPVAPPVGPMVATDRALDEEALLAGGSAWCNEQARVFIRLSQGLGIPARLVHLFYANIKSGHTVVECCLDGQWAMVDPMWAVVFPSPDGGRLMSAAECHGGGTNSAAVKRAYQQRFRQLERLPDAALGGAQNAAGLRQLLRADWGGDDGGPYALHTFAVINHPLPA